MTSKNRKSGGRSLGRATLICLKLLHPASSLSAVKLAALRRRSTDEIIASLEPGKYDSLKAHPDGTVVDGHHRLAVLCERSVDINQLPREIVPR